MLCLGRQTRSVFTVCLQPLTVCKEAGCIKGRCQVIRDGTLELPNLEEVLFIYFLAFNKKDILRQLLHMFPCTGTHISTHQISQGCIALTHTYITPACAFGTCLLTLTIRHTFLIHPAHAHTNICHSLQTLVTPTSAPDTPTCMCITHVPTTRPTCAQIDLVHLPTCKL